MTQSILGSLIPLPKRIVETSGTFHSRELEVFIGCDDRRIPHAVDRLAAGQWQRKSSVDGASLCLLLESHVSIPEGLSEEIRSEAYCLDIEEVQIRVHARSPKGLFYGLQTLNQMLVQNREIPCCLITDWPDMEMRGVHLTLGSGYMPPYPKLLEIVDRMASFKINNFHIEYDASFRWEKYPFIAIPSALTKDQCRELILAAGDRFIEVVPTIDSLGHQEHYLSHVELTHLRESPESVAELCPSNPKSMEFIQDLWSEVLEVHSNAKYVNITGDEVFRLGRFCPRCKSYADRGHLADLFFDHYNRLSMWMLGQGYRPMMWHDMLANHPERLKEYSREIMILYWNYWGSDAVRWSVGHGLPSELLHEDLDGVPESIRKLYLPYWIHPSTQPDFTPWPYLRFFQDCGFATLGASAGSPITERFPFAGFDGRIKNAKSMARGVHAIGGKGVVHTYWSDWTSFLTAWADIGAMGDYSWHSREESTESYLSRFDAIFFGTTGRFGLAALNYDELSYPSKAPYFDVIGHLPDSDAIASLQSQWRDTVASCQRNSEMLEILEPTVEFTAARAAARRLAELKFKQRFKSGVDITLDLGGVFNGSTRQLIASATGACLDIAPGTYTALGVKVAIGSCENGKRNAIILKGGHNKLYSRQIVIPVDTRLFDQVFFWHAASYGGAQECLAEYEMHYDDGSIEILPVLKNVNLGDWNRGVEVLPKAVVAWQGFSNLEDKGRRMLYLAEWENPFPTKSINEIRLTSMEKEGNVFLLAVTGRECTSIQDQERESSWSKEEREVVHHIERFNEQYGKVLQGRCVPEHIKLALDHANIAQYLPHLD